MSDVFWAGLFGLCTAVSVTWLTHVFNLRMSSKEASRTEAREAEQQAWNESRRREDIERDESHRREELARDEARRQAEIVREEKRREEEFHLRQEELRLREQELGRQEGRHQAQLQRDEAHRREALHAARLREFWEHVLQAHFQLSELVRRKRRKESVPFDQELPSAGAVKASAVALLGLNELYVPAKRLCQAAVQVELSLSRFDPTRPKVDADDSQWMTETMQDWQKAFVALEGRVAKMTGALSGSAPE